jgi:hypothetical protein
VHRYPAPGTTATAHPRTLKAAAVSCAVVLACAGSLAVAIVLGPGIARAEAPAPTPTPTPSASPTPTPAPTPEATRNTKLALLNQLTVAPDMLIFGSSRAMRVNPADYGTFTGRSGFNLAVSSGTVADAYCMAQYVRDRFPGTTQRYLWLLDVEQFRLDRVHRAIYAQPELAKYVPAAFPSPFAPSASPTPTPAPTVAPLPPYGPVDIFDANGWLRWNRYDYWRSRSRTLVKGLAYSRWKFGQVYPKGYTTMKGVAKWFVGDTIRLMNEWGAVPVIVLTPYQPVLYKFISTRGFTERHAAVLAYFTKLSQQGRQFVLLDCTQIASFGGWSHGFYDGTHMRTTLSKMLLLHAVVNSGGAL